MPAPSDLLRTPLYDWHYDQGARIVDFAGWAMPVQYTSIVEEHRATRSAVGLFDVSHMGRIRFDGPDAEKFLDFVLTRRVSDLKPWRARYSFICNDEGGILDDVLIYRLEADDKTGRPQPTWQLVVNASNRSKILNWLAARRQGFDVRFEDATRATAMIAIQGPQAASVFGPDCSSPLSGMKYFDATTARLADVPGVISRTGYTGEDGYEFICAAEGAAQVWQTGLKAAEKVGGCAVGLGARDTLRLEAALPLYGHELSEGINPAQTGLPFAYDLEGRDFIGREAIRRQLDNEQLPVRAGLQLHGRRPAREGAKVLGDGSEVGEVTSGTFSPTRERPIALAYLARPASSVGQQVVVDIRGHHEPATVVALPFYQRKK